MAGTDFQELPSLGTLVPNSNRASLPLFERKGWRRMAFGEFALSVNERAEPKDAQDEIYVGLEHLDSQCLHIRRWGKGSDVTGSKLRFRKGDLIFGRRRAYQRKLAVAQFDGICSAHAMVIRAKKEKVLPEFLPFLMMSDRFMNRAVEISVGSLSPTINWTTLKLEEFDLPPLDQQRRIAEILWAVDDQIKGQETLKSRSIEFRNTRIREIGSSAGASVELGDLAKNITSGSRGWAEHYSEKGAVFVRITNLKRNDVRFDWRDIQRVVPPATLESKRTLVLKDDLLISITAELGLIAIAEQMPGDCYINQHIAKVTLNQNKYDPFLAGLFLSLPPYSDQFRRLNDQGTKAGMNLKNVARLKLPDIPQIQQELIAAELRRLNATIVAMECALDTTRQLRGRLLDNIIN